MANLTPVNQITIEDALGELSQYKYFPNKIVNISLNRLNDMLNGMVDFVDPSNPFVYLLETSALNTAYAIQEYTLLTRRLYPRLANNESDLYLHMSDFDFLGIYSEPAYANITFNFLLNDITTKAYYDSTLGRRILKIPRNFQVSVDKYVFTITSAIYLVRNDNGVIDIYYENQTYDNLFPVTTNHIDFKVVKINQEETYVQFQINAPEVLIESTEIPIEKSKLFRGTLTYTQNRQFYYFKAYYYLNQKWNEMLVTHTQDVYDINKPTCIIEVLKDTNEVNYYIPSVYINNNLLGSKVKFLIYTTNGPIDVNFLNYNVTDFQATYANIFPDVELDDTTAPLNIISKVIYIEEEVVGGKNQIDFATLKESVIDNSIGDRKLPITRNQLSFEASQLNFNLITDVDVITNRIFLLSLNLPNAKTRYPVAKLNLDILEYKTTISEIAQNKNNVYVFSDSLLSIAKGAIFKLGDNWLDFLSVDEYTNLLNLSQEALVYELNNNHYFATLFHYIIETKNNTVDFRAYDIEDPQLSNINFKLFNDTSQIGMNTSSISIEKTQVGYTLSLMTNLKKYRNDFTAYDIDVYLVYTDDNNSNFFLKGSLYTIVDDNPLYKFYIDSNFIINSDNQILITNFTDSNAIATSIWMPLKTNLSILYVTNNLSKNYKANDIDSYFVGSFLANGFASITLEEIELTFGVNLERLYRRTHSAVTGYDYEVYTENIPLRYDTNVYDDNNNIIHYKGEIVKDEHGNVVYQYKIGEIKLDENNQPIIRNVRDTLRFFNFCFIDYRALVATNPNIVNYVTYLRNYISANCTENAAKFNDLLLENTESFLTIPKNIDYIKVLSENIQYYIPSMQVFNVVVYVREQVYLDNNTRDKISYTIIKLLDEYLYNNTILIKTQVLDIIYNEIKSYVKSITFSLFTELNSEYIEILDANARISLDKKITSELTGYNLVENVTIEFKLVN